MQSSLEEKNITLTLKDKDLRKTIEAQLKIGFKVKENKKFIDKINNKKFNKKEMLELSQKNEVIAKLLPEHIASKKRPG